MAGTNVVAARETHGSDGEHDLTRIQASISVVNTYRFWGPMVCVGRKKVVQCI